MDYPTWLLPFAAAAAEFIQTSLNTINLRIIIILSLSSLCRSLSACCPIWALELSSPFVAYFCALCLCLLRFYCICYAWAHCPSTLRLWSDLLPLPSLSLLLSPALSSSFGLICQASFSRFVFMISICWGRRSSYVRGGGAGAWLQAAQCNYHLNRGTPPPPLCLRLLIARKNNAQV